MTVMCLHCSKNKSSVVGFVVRGVFCDRTTVWGKAPNENKKYPWYVKKHLGKKICLCKDCGISLSRDGESNIVGFLNQRQYTSYKNDAKKCDILHKQGYLVLEERHWKDKWNLGNFGLNELKECFEQKKVKIQNLKSHDCTVEGSPKKHFGTRRWALWKGNTNFVEKAITNCKGGEHPSWGGVRSTASSRPLVDNSFIHTDIHHARIARDNVKHELSHTSLKHEETLELVDFACLWRRTKIDMGQCAHADTDAGHLHIVMPLSSEPYEIEVWPYTHLTTSRCSNDNIVTSSNKITLHLRIGQILIFCSNLVHCGGRSRHPSKNLETIKKTIKIDWFTGKNENEPIADLSIHASLQNTLNKQNIRSNYTTGAAEFIRVHILDEMEQKSGADCAMKYETITMKKIKAIQYLIKMKNERFNEDVHMGKGSATNSSCNCVRDSRKRRRDNSTTEEKEGGKQELINNCPLLFHFLDDATRAIMALKKDRVGAEV